MPNNPYPSDGEIADEAAIDNADLSAAHFLRALQYLAGFASGHAHDALSEAVHDAITDEVCSSDADCPDYVAEELAKDVKRGAPTTLLDAVLAIADNWPALAGNTGSKVSAKAEAAFIRQMLRCTVTGGGNPSQPFSRDLDLAVQLLCQSLPPLLDERASSFSIMWVGLKGAPFWTVAAQWPGRTVFMSRSPHPTTPGRVAADVFAGLQALRAPVFSPSDLADAEFGAAFAGDRK